jgi:N-acetyl-anhydromuramyl-L-alanine amidase AmpD
MDKFITVLSPNKYNGRRRKLRLIVWHSTESSEVIGGAYAVAANWFGLLKSKVSAHVVVDDGLDPRYASGVVQCVLPEDTAWHAGNVNADGYGVEIVGKAAQGVGWQDTYSLAAIQNACEWINWLPAISWIPHRWLTDAQLRSGEAGHVTHEQCARVLGGSDHTDPGPSFPKAYVMSCLGGENPGPPDVPTNVDVPLTYGMRDDPNVRKFQLFMARVFPTYAGDLPATGNYLDQTWKVVREFQARANVLNADGSKPDGKRVGPMTYAALRRYGWR